MTSSLCSTTAAAVLCLQLLLLPGAHRQPFHTVLLSYCVATSGAGYVLSSGRAMCSTRVQPPARVDLADLLRCYTLLAVSAACGPWQPRRAAAAVGLVANIAAVRRNAGQHHVRNPAQYKAPGSATALQLWPHANEPSVRGRLLGVISSGYKQSGGRILGKLLEAPVGAGVCMIIMRTRGHATVTWSSLRCLWLNLFRSRLCRQAPTANRNNLLSSHTTASYSLLPIMHSC
jgi:hypothetical protein